MGDPQAGDVQAADVGRHELLVEQLRKRGSWVTTRFVPLIPQMNEEEWVPDALCAEAADAIEALIAAARGDQP